MKCKLKDVDEAPDEWITTLENLKVRLQDVNHKMEDMDLLLHIVVNIPASYNTVVEIVQDNLKNGSLTLETLRSKLNIKFKRLHKDSKQDEEKGLSLVDRKSLIKCKYCGRQGHKSEDCWSLEKNKEKFEKFKEKFWKVK